MVAGGVGLGVGVCRGVGVAIGVGWAVGCPQAISTTPNRVATVTRLTTGEGS